MTALRGTATLCGRRHSARYIASSLCQFQFPPNIELSRQHLEGEMNPPKNHLGRSCGAVRSSRLTTTATMLRSTSLETSSKERMFLHHRRLPVRHLQGVLREMPQMLLLLVNENLRMTKETSHRPRGAESMEGKSPL